MFQMCHLLIVAHIFYTNFAKFEDFYLDNCSIQNVKVTQFIYRNKDMTVST